MFLVMFVYFLIDQLLKITNVQFVLNSHDYLDNLLNTLLFPLLSPPAFSPPNFFIHDIGI